MAGVADQHVVSGAAGQNSAGDAAEKDVIAVAAIGGEQYAGEPRRIDDVVAAEAIDDKAIVRCFGA